MAARWLKHGRSGSALGAHQVVQRAAARARWPNDVPEHARETLLPTAWSNIWADATFTEPTPGDVSASAQLRAPSGTILDSREYWAAGKAIYDPGQITLTWVYQTCNSAR